MFGIHGLTFRMFFGPDTLAIFNAHGLTDFDPSTGYFWARASAVIVHRPGAEFDHVGTCNL